MIQLYRSLVLALQLLFTRMMTLTARIFSVVELVLGFSNFYQSSVVVQQDIRGPIVHVCIC